MEASLGHDFSNVRIRQGPEAGARDALAYTQGEVIHFAPGLYDPHTRRGQEMLGHELTHVVQQRHGRVKVSHPGAGFPLNAEARLEEQADRAGARAAQGAAARELHTSDQTPRSDVAADATPAPIQRMRAFVQGTGEYINLKKTGHKSGEVYKHKDSGRLFNLTTATQAHPVSGKSTPVVAPRPSKKLKVKMKDKLESGYDSGGDSGSESDLDPNDYLDANSEDEAEWEVLDKGKGRDEFWDRSVTSESKHFGVDPGLTTTTHHALATDIGKGLVSGKNATPIDLENVSASDYIRAHVKATKDNPTGTWGGTNQQPRQKFSFGETDISQQRKPSPNQPMNLQVASFGHYGIPKPGETGVYPSEKVLGDMEVETGKDKVAMAKRARKMLSRGKPMKTSKMRNKDIPGLRRLHALMHLAGREEVLRAISKTNVSDRAPAGIGLAMGLEMLEKSPKVSNRLVFGRSAKYGPMTPEGVAKDPKMFKRRLLNLLHRVGKEKLRRNEKLRKKVTTGGKSVKDVGKSFVLVPTQARIQRYLNETFGA